jgi:hypothetical protein
MESDEQAMSFPGSALIALWNDRAKHRSDYDIWHTREHVPQRLSVAGFVSARRYSEGDGPLPTYMTLYALTGMDVLVSDSYRRLLQEPTPWSLSMRPDFARFLRLACTLRASRGGGLGGWAMAALARQVSQSADLEERLDRLLCQPGITAIHYASVDRGSPNVPFVVPREDGVDADGVLLVEGYKSDLIRAAYPDVEARLAPCLRLEKQTFYRLAFALEARDRDSMAQVMGGPTQSQEER